MKMIVGYIVALLVVILGLHSCFDEARAEDSVAVAIVMAADVSGSINDDRFKLQREGYAEALTSPAVLQAMDGRCIALVYMEWSDTRTVVVPWTRICNAQEAAAFASTLYNSVRSSSGMTPIGEALRASLRLMDECPWATRTRVIDVSGDGVNNSGESPVGPRDEAMRRGIRINGLAILGDSPPVDLEEHYRNAVITEDGFLMMAHGFESFAYAMINKLRREMV